MNIRLVVLLFGLLLFSCKNDEVIDLQITWNLETNYPDGGHRASWSLTHNGGIDLDAQNWAIYWNMAPREIDPASITAPVSMRWINGDFYEMKPTSGFSLKKGETIQVTYEGSAFMIKESDGPLGVYIVLEKDGASQSFTVQDMTILPFDSPDQINRDASDEEPIPTPEWLYLQNEELSLVPEEDLPLILPEPTGVKRTGETLDLRNIKEIHYQSNLKNEAILLSEALKKHAGLDLPTKRSNKQGPGIIKLELQDPAVEGTYSLEIMTDGVVIRGDAAGVFYGGQTLRGLLPVISDGEENTAIEVPTVQVTDQPALNHRGMFIDICRNFNSPNTLKRMIDVMAYYKLNRLHIHLSEDEAWRIEIQELPELTEIGSFRGHTLDDTQHLQPSYGSGPHPDPESGYGSGYYSREEFKDLIRYAYDRHIKVIPEINVPGHSRAAIKAMEHRYHKYMAAGDTEEALKYRLIDPNDQSEYRSAQWYTDNIICVCQESAFRFFTTVVDDIIEMYDEAEVPLEMFHTGGDEVPRGAWTASPICDEFLKRYPEIDNPKNLQKVFFNRIQEYLANKGLQVGGWEEIAQNFYEDGSWEVNTQFSNSAVVPFVWNSLWGAEDLSNQLANAGYPVVLCHVTNFYFDLAYNKDPREAGLYWGGFVDTKDAYVYDPYDVFKSIKVDSWGRKYKDADFEDMEPLKPSARNKIMGIQAQLWSETIKGQDMVEHYILPKMIGLAERAWRGQDQWALIGQRETRKMASDAAWNRFANMVGRKEFKRLDKLSGGYNYRLPAPGALIRDGMVYANSAYPGTEIRYTTDGTTPDLNSPVYEGPIDLGDQVITIATMDSRGRTSLTSQIDPGKIQSNDLVD